jgi:hypothetical protein
VADMRRRRVAADRQALGRVGLAGLAIIALTFVPLAIHELTTNFSEIEAALRYLRAGGEPARLDLVPRLLVIAARITSWPLAGLITAGPTAAIVAISGVLGLTIWRVAAARGEERIAVRWLALGLAWTALALSMISPSLATVTPGLPNDHYHAFADPMVFVLVGIGVAALSASGGRAIAGAGGTIAVTPGRALAVVGLFAIIAWAATHQPPAVAPDGGFPAAEAAAARIEGAVREDPIRLRSLPLFKTAEAYAYPLVRDGRSVEVAAPDGGATIAGSTLVILCDSLFESSIGAPCGGPAESAVASTEGYGTPVDRFRAAPRQTISIYRAPQGAIQP